MKHLVAAIIFFTRLPLWRIKKLVIPQEYYKQVANYWPVAGWITGGTMAAVLWLAAQFLPLSVAVILAIVARLVLNGALHEDGFADFLDGFGGGTSRERILAIMKDSHIGVYGVIGLVVYFLLLWQILAHLPLSTAIVAILAADPFSKFVSSHITLFLPYARTAETNKSRVVYNRMSFSVWLVALVFGMLPLVLIPNFSWLLACILPVLVFLVTIYLMKKKINGYTGDCCGAQFILCELSFYLSVLIMNQI